jgi:hypothetical protein
MGEYSIEILGQKFSYPTTWQGTASILVVCLALVAIAFIFDGERIKAIGDVIDSASKATIDDALQKANTTITNQANEISQLTETLASLKGPTGQTNTSMPSTNENLRQSRSITTSSLRDYLDAEMKATNSLDKLFNTCTDCSEADATDVKPNYKLQAVLEKLESQSLVTDGE